MTRIKQFSCKLACAASFWGGKLLSKSFALRVFFIAAETLSLSFWSPKLSFQSPSNPLEVLGFATATSRGNRLMLKD